MNSGVGTVGNNPVNRVDPFGLCDPVDVNIVLFNPDVNDDGFYQFSFWFQGIAVGAGANDSVETIVFKILKAAGNNNINSILVVGHGYTGNLKFGEHYLVDIIKQLGLLKKKGVKEMTFAQCMGPKPWSSDDSFDWATAKATREAQAQAASNFFGANVYYSTSTVYPLVGFGSFTTHLKYAAPR